MSGLSGVMVVHGRAGVATRAVAAWFDHAPPNAELVVVDNASSDDAAARIAGAFPGVVLVEAGENLGFGGGANLGVRHARGSEVVILNSDAMVEPGWFEPIAEVLAGDPRVGAVAPAYVDEDGVLAEAGSVIGPDARTMALREPPASAAVVADGAVVPPELAFTRTVDFASAAALVIRRRAFEEAGGFDPVFGVGYYEDVDLCLRMATLGWRTVVEPRSRVTHLGGASMVTGEAARRSAENRPVILERWGAVLATRPPLEDLERYPHRWFAARDATAPLRVLAAAGPGEAGRAIERLAEFRAAAPGMRATLVVPPGISAEADSALPAWLEVAELAEAGVQRESWFRARRFHYSVVLGPDRPPDGAGARWQPQAARVDLEGSPVRPG